MRCWLMSVIALLGAGTASASNSWLAGEWHLRDGEHRLTLVLTHDEPTGWSGTISDGVDVVPVDSIVWSPGDGLVRFRQTGDADWRWYSGQVAEGVIKLRSAVTTVGDSEPGNIAFTRHVTGWNRTILDAASNTRVWDLVLNQHYLSRLRIDHTDIEGSLVGQLKVYAASDPDVVANCVTSTTANPRYDYWISPEYERSSLGARCEEMEYDVEVSAWDGELLQFTRHHDTFWQVFEGYAQGDTIQGTFTQSGTPEVFTWSGRRAEVLASSLLAQESNDLNNWQSVTRSRLALLKMAGAPSPLSSHVQVLADNLPPQSDAAMPGWRDDNAQAWPQTYRMAELDFLFTLPNPHGAQPLERRAHGYLATPDHGGSTPMPAVLVLNGHGGSGWTMMDPAHPYWYGDAFARRGYIVLALDMSHRDHGDDPSNGNSAHPPIAAPGYSSDWEEEGERVWTAMRGIDYLISREDVDPSRIVIAGLSMGGEIAAITAAMDTRISTAVVAGYTPDFSVMAWNNNHPCWEWQHADIREYVEMSDYLRLIAPRQLIAMTGRLDAVFSRFDPPFAADKQVMRRSTPDHDHPHGWRPIHYLHDRGHDFRVGDVTVDGQPRANIRVPALSRPTQPGQLNWQIDPQTIDTGQTLFDVIGNGSDRLFADGFEMPPGH